MLGRILEQWTNWDALELNDPLYNSIPIDWILFSLSWYPMLLIHFYLLRVIPCSVPCLLMGWRHKSCLLSHSLLATTRQGRSTVIYTCSCLTYRSSNCPKLGCFHLIRQGKNWGYNIFGGQEHKEVFYSCQPTSASGTSCIDCCCLSKYVSILIVL